jgi:hypothetical protein
MAHDHSSHDVEYILLLDLYGPLFAQAAAVPRGEKQSFPDSPLAMYMASHPAAASETARVDPDVPEALADATPQADGSPEGEWQGLTLELPKPPATWPWVWFDED